MQSTDPMDLIIVQSNQMQTRKSLLARYDPGGTLSLDQKLERAHVLGSLPYALGHQIYWSLVPRDTPETDDILSSVSTIVRTVATQRKRIPSPFIGEGEADYSPIEHTAFSITHVITPEELRKKGYATRMMTLLHQKLSNNLVPPSDGSQENLPYPDYPRGILSFLYSGVGDFYSRCGPPGWRVQTSTETYWDMNKLLQTLPSKPLGIKYLTEDHFPEIGERDASMLRAELATRARNGDPPAFAVLPIGGDFQWLVARSKFYGGILSSSPLPIYWGAELDADNFAIWFIDYDKKELHFLRLRCQDSCRLKAMVQAAAVIAGEQGCSRILAWNLDNEILRGSEFPQGSCATGNRKKNLAAVAWYGEGDCPVWIANEKYGWC